MDKPHLNFTSFSRRLGALGLAFGLAQALHAAAPLEINYQGKLANTSGVPVNGNQDITFRICDAATGPCGFSTTKNVAVNNGLFNVVIDGIPANTFSASATKYLEVDVAGSGAFPRQKLVSS